MDDNKAIIDLRSSKNIIEFLKAPTLKISELLTGLIASDKSEYKLSAGHLVQAAIKCNLYEQLGREIKHYRDKGKIKEDFFSTDKQRATLREMLEFIDKDSPDEDRFKAMKSIFLRAISTEATAEDEALAYELMQIGKKLESNDIIVLKAIYLLYKKIEAENSPAKVANDGVQGWVTYVTKNSGHNVKELTLLSEQRLTDLKIISGRKYPDGSGMYNVETARLTPLGLKLCEFITAYQ
ncbi:MAG: hypothetical protein WCY36_05785 [Candidatus Omnitrophota bacterium]